MQKMLLNMHTNIQKCIFLLYAKKSLQINFTKYNLKFNYILCKIKNIKY
jgi:hypothetical protein